MLSDIKILVLSCDKNADLFEPFHHCIEKYWPDHPEIIYLTETIQNPYYKTICKNYPIEQWSLRVRDAAMEIPTKFILETQDDVFIRQYVDNSEIELLAKYITGNVCSINLEGYYTNTDTILDKFVSKHEISKTKYKTSIMYMLYDRQKMIKVFNVSMDPWSFEKATPPIEYDYLISNKRIIYSGRENYYTGVWQGKWSQEAKFFLEKEGLQIDFDKRGVLGEKYFNRIVSNTHLMI